MEKIYSRKRIRLPYINFKNFNRFPRGRLDIKKRITSEILLTITIAIFAMVMIINAINPIIDKICVDESRNKATLIANKMTTEVMKDYNYEDLVTINRDDDGNVSMLEANIMKINAIASDVAVKIQEEINENSGSKVHIKLRQFDRH